MKTITDTEALLTDEVADDIVLTAKMFGITEKQAAEIVFDRLKIPRYEINTHLSMWAFTIKILGARKRLEEITKKAQS